MSDSVFDLNRREPPAVDEDPAPEFGLVDVVEAFTAMRHEWRGQTKESREISASLQAAVTNIQALESKLLALATTNDTIEAQKLVELIADTENQLTRSVFAGHQAETHRNQREANAVADFFNAMNPLARWASLPLLNFVAAQRQARQETIDDQVVAGPQLVLERLRRMMTERQLERVDTLGQPFDAETMNAIGTVATHDCPAGHVAEQISPCYLWRGRLLRFAAVRVACSHNEQA